MVGNSDIMKGIILFSSILITVLNCNPQFYVKEKDMVSLKIVNDKVSLYSDTVYYEIKNKSNNKLLIFKPDIFTFRSFENYRKENPFRFTGKVFNSYSTIVKPNIWEINISSNTLQEYLEQSKEEEKTNNYILSKSIKNIEDSVLYLQKFYLLNRLLILNPNEKYSGVLKVNLWSDSRIYFPSQGESYFAIDKDSLTEFRIELNTENFNMDKFLTKELLDSLNNQNIKVLNKSLISNKVKIDTIRN